MTEADEVCAKCGAAEVDNVKLKECTDCDLVKYCSDKCREEHREQHNEECKNRAKELHDKKLFTQPDGNHEGECPLCFFPMPLDNQKCSFHSCCSKLICDGCRYAHIIKSNESNRWNCPFCREPAPEDGEEREKRMMKRIKANDPAAMREMGLRCYHEGDYKGAFNYLTMAAELEDIRAHYVLGQMYLKGHGVKKDEEKAVYHSEKAAMGGDPYARFDLACYEERKGNIERAVKHSIIAANLGHELSMKELWGAYKEGCITKEDLESTLRTHQAALDEMKSPEREVAEAWRETQRVRDARRRN